MKAFPHFCRRTNSDKSRTPIESCLQDPGAVPHSTRTLSRRTRLASRNRIKTYLLVRLTHTEHIHSYHYLDQLARRDADEISSFYARRYKAKDGYIALVRGTGIGAGTALRAVLPNDWLFFASPHTHLLPDWDPATLLRVHMRCDRPATDESRRGKCTYMKLKFFSRKQTRERP